MRVIAPLLSAAGFFAGAQPVLRGEGLVLRQWRGRDARFVARAFADPAISHWHMLSLSAAEAPGWVDLRSRRWHERAGADWAVAAQGAEDEVLARIGIHRFELGQGIGEVAYWVLPEARGQRLAARSLNVLCEWAFRERGLHRLELMHSVGNPASCGVAERAGFALEGTRRDALRHADGWHDMHMHARLAGDPPGPVR